MKNLITTIITILVVSGLYAQNINQSFKLNNSETLDIKTDYASLTIHQGTGNEIVIKGTVTFNGKPVVDPVEFVWDDNSSYLHIKTDIKNWSFKDKYKNESEDYLDNLSKEELKAIIKHNKNHGNWDFHAKLDVYLPQSINALDIKSTYGSIEVDRLPVNVNIKNTYGSITASANTLFQNCTLVSTYSSVTLNLPESAPTGIKLQSNYGEIYTDIDFDINSEESTNKAYKTIIIGSLNNGKSKMVQMRSDYSNVYLRKS